MFALERGYNGPDAMICQHYQLKMTRQRCLGAQHTDDCRGCWQGRQVRAEMGLKPIKTCKNGCDRQVYARGLCQRCYNARWHRRQARMVERYG